MEHAPGEFSVLAHLQNGSLAVAVGETVKRGQRVARCGNSGNTALPHLHFSFLGNYGDTRISLPAAFSDYTAWRDGAIKKIARGVPTLDEIVQSTPLESPAPTNDAEKSMR
jgi:murein DD-endopeptidase MepM/ murein hydrolase activator NlpD